MLFDHIGKIVFYFFPSDTNYNINFAFTIIGRLALPIFIFLLIEGFVHTNNIKKYFLRLGILAVVIGVTEIILGSIPSLNLADTLLKAGNIFIDLLLILLILFLFNQKNILHKVLILIPILYFVIALLIQNETIYIFSDYAKAFLSAFMPQYAFISPLIVVLYLLINYLYNLQVNKKFGEEALSTIDIVTFKKDIRINSFIISILLVSLLMYLFSYVIQDANVLNTNYVSNTYFALAIIPIFFYNGKLGKTNKIIKSAYYLFYPIHLVIIFLITYLVSII